MPTAPASTWASAASPCRGCRLRPRQPRSRQHGSGKAEWRRGGRVPTSDTIIAGRFADRQPHAVRHSCRDRSKRHRWRNRRRQVGTVHYPATVMRSAGPAIVIATANAGSVRCGTPLQLASAHAAVKITRERMTSRALGPLPRTAGTRQRRLNTLPVHEPCISDRRRHSGCERRQSGAQKVAART
jgi:hypothetical protein